MAKHAATKEDAKYNRGITAHSKPKKDKSVKSQTFFKGAMIMSIAIIVVKLCGMVYKVALTRVYGLFGEELASFGMGLFNNAYEIYVPLFTIATGGFPIAISRLISESNAQNRYKDIRRIHKVSLPVFIVMGIVCTLLMFMGSFFYIKIIDSPYALPSMICLSPTIFFGCLVAVYRGYFEGLRNMTATSVSEIIEGLSKLAIGLTLSYVIMKLGMDSYEANGTIFGLTFEDKTTAFYTLVSYSVSGAVLGITIGGLLSFLYVFIKYKRCNGGITEEQIHNSVDAKSKDAIFKVLLKTAIPIGLGALVMNISGTIDGMIIQRVISDMAETNSAELARQYPMYVGAIKNGTLQTSLWGCYGAALTLMQLVTAITQVFGSTAMPNVTNAYTKGDRKELRASMNKVLKLTCIVTLPLGIGMAVLADPIMQITYGGSVAIVGAKCLRIMGLAVLFMAASTPICSMLQGVGKVSTPVTLYTIAVIIKIIMNFLLVTNVDINIAGAATGTLVGYLFVCVVAMYILVKSTNIRPDFMNTVIKPFIGAITCGLIAYAVYYWFAINFFGVFVATMISVCVAAAVYLIVLILLKTFTAEDLSMFTKNPKLASIFSKLGIV
ncbi:MAG: polysaccharide biosynthesis protein [Ruminococcus sp.]|nr:polysaccharide biosynthesis protein [Ruminococcus sp.]